MCKEGLILCEKEVWPISQDSHERLREYLNSEEMERFSEGATLPSEVNLAKSKILYIFEVVNKKTA